MGIIRNAWSRLFKSSTNDSDILAIKSEVKDMRLAISKQSDPNTMKVATAKSQRPANPTLTYKAGIGSRLWPSLGNEDYIGPMYNLGEIAKATDVESYLAVTIRRHRELSMKEGWKLTGKNPETIKYMKKRFMELELMSGESTGSLIRNIITDLVAYSNSMIVLKRDSGRSSGNRIRMFGKKLEPISAIYIADPTSMKVKKNEWGRVSEWKQSLASESSDRKYRYSDVIHFFLDRKSGFTFGTPFAVPVLEDIRALRRLEELVETVTHKHTFPFFHMQVGTDQNPASTVSTPGGEIISEVDIYQGLVSGLPPEGGLVTSERATIKMLGTEGQVLDLEKYLKHFELRVLGGLRLSGIDLGRGDTANRGTATSMTRNLVDACVEIQNVVSETVDSKILDILLLEGGYDLNEEDRVHLVFPDIDRDELRAHQNHGADLYLKNAITHDELREDYLDRNILTKSEEKRLYYELFEKPKLEAAATLKDPKPGSENKTRPKNQNGVSSTRKKIPANDGNDSRRIDLDTYEQYSDQLSYYWRQLMLEFMDKSGITIKNKRIAGRSDHLKSVLRGYTDMMVGDARKFLTPLIESGYKQACEDMGIEFNMSKDTLTNFFGRRVTSMLKRTNRKAMMMLGLDINSGACNGSAPDRFKVSGVFDALQSEIDRSAFVHTDQAYKIGYLEALSNNGHKNVVLQIDTEDPTSMTDDISAMTTTIEDLKRVNLASPFKDHECFLLAEGVSLIDQTESKGEAS